LRKDVTLNSKHLPRENGAKSETILNDKNPKFKTKKQMAFENLIIWINVFKHNPLLFCFFKISILDSYLPQLLINLLQKPFDRQGFLH